jgi:eukaryotic-like serine/threonine-protein kinase
MGEVYRARDTKLGRDVALKILPDAFAQDRERLARFQREAQVLASLNHQNIAAIYGLEDSTDSTHALVMELVEGPTLAERIDAGPIPLAEALPIATQIAEALETAHELGIIHRDLKPANIKLRPDGTVKVLDFGLAKMIETADGRAANSNATYSPTISLAATQAGVILGTASYMAPEQARGRVVDKRADVWAFGVVLYEMLTGTRAFPGEDVSDTLATVLKFDPDWNLLPASTPASIHRLLKRCLTKDPKLRLRECGSALLEIRDATTSPDGSEAAARFEPVADQARRRLVLPVIVTALVAAAAGAAAWARLGAPASPDPSPTSRLTITLPEGDTLPRNSGVLIGLSPDGRTLVFRATRGEQTHVFRRAVDQFEATIVPVGNVNDHSFSPDGRWMIYTERSGSAVLLKKIPVAGGPAQTLSTLRSLTRGTAWTEDGRIIMGENAPGSSGLISVPAAGGDPAPLYKPAGNVNVWQPQVLGADVVLVTLASTASPGDGEIAVVTLGTGEKKTVMANAIAGRLLPTGHLIFLRGSALWAVPFNAARLEAVGIAAPVVEGVRVETGGAAQFSVADDGTLAYLPGTTASELDRQFSFVGRDGTPSETLKIPPRAYFNLALSADQRFIAVQIGDADDADVWVAEIARGTLTRVTRERGFDGFPLWSPDSKSIVFASSRDNRWTLQRRSADGTGAATLLATFDQGVASVVPYSWSLDGQTLFGADNSIGVTMPGSNGEWKALIESALAPAMSPDNRWIAYTSVSSGAPEVYLQGFPNAGQRHIVSIGGGHTARWARGTGELFYLRGGPPNAVMRVAVRPTRDGGVDIGTPEVFTPFRFFTRRGGNPYDVTPDGTRVLVATLANPLADSSPRINVVLNWFEELKRLVPVGK